MRISQIAGSFILGIAATISSQNTEAESKSNLTTLSKNVTDEKPKSVQKEITLEGLVKKVEDLLPGTKERKETLEFLKQTAIAQAKSQDKAIIRLKLIEILNKKEVENWKELTPIILSIIQEQAIINGKVLSREKDGEIKLLEIDKTLAEPLSKILLTTLFDIKSSKDLKEEARTGFCTLINEPFGYKESFFSFQKEKLKSLCELPEDRLSKIGENCEELTNIYQRFARGTEILQKELAPHLKKLLEINLNLIKDDDKKLAVAGNNLTSLSKLFWHYNPWWVKENKYYIAKDVKAYELSSPFFKNVLWKNETISPKRIELLVKISEALLELSLVGEQDNPTAFTLESNKLYVNWLTKQINNSIKDRPKDSLERQKVLEYAIRNEIHHHRIVPNLRGELFKTLIYKHIELTNHNISNADFLSNALGTFTYLKDYTYNYYSELNDNNKKELGDAALSLFYVACDGIEKLSASDDIKKLNVDLLKAPGFIDNTDKDNLDKCLNHLSTILCKKSSNDSEEFMQTVRALLDTNLERPETTWSPHLLHNFMANNLDYFGKHTVKIIDTYKNSINTDLKTKSLNDITELYLFFHQIHRIGKYAYMARITPTGWHKQGGSTDLTPPELQPIYKKTNDWFIKKLDKPFIEIILNDLATQKDNKKWEEFNKKIQKIESYHPSIDHQNRKEIIIQSLKTISPHFQKLNRAALELATSPDHEDTILINILKDAIAKETSPKVLQSIGQVVSYGTLHNLNLRKEFNFFQGLHYSNKRKELNSMETTLFHNLILELVRITEGDSKVFKSYLPDCSFKTGKDGKINLKDFDALMKLRRNAFFTLSYLANEHSEYLYKPLTRLYRDTIIDILENGFERYDRPENLIKTWGEEAGVLVIVYSNMHGTLSENTIHAKLKIDFLKERFFDGTTSLFNKVLEHDFIELNPKKNRKILDDICYTPKLGEEVRKAIFKEAPALQAIYTEDRKLFGVAFVKTLSIQQPGYIDEHLKHLRQLGFKDSEVKNIAKSITGIKK